MAADTAMLLASGLSSVGSVMSGVQKYQTGLYNQGIANTEAQQTQSLAASEAQEQGIQTQQLLGRQLAAAGASGVDPDQGSPANVASFTAQQGKLQQALTLYRGQIEANQFKQQGALQAWQGSNALASGIVGAGVTALTGYNKATNPYSPSSTVGGVGPALSQGNGITMPLSWLSELTS